MSVLLVAIKILQHRRPSHYWKVKEAKNVQILPNNAPAAVSVRMDFTLTFP